MCALLATCALALLAMFMEGVQRAVPWDLQAAFNR